MKSIRKLESPGPLYADDYNALAAEVMLLARTNATGDEIDFESDQSGQRFTVHPTNRSTWAKLEARAGKRYKWIEQRIRFNETDATIHYENASASNEILEAGDPDSSFALEVNGAELNTFPRYVRLWEAEFRFGTSSVSQPSFTLWLFDTGGDEAYMAWIRATTASETYPTLYSGIEEAFDPVTATWSNVRTVWLFDPNDSTPSFTSGVRYLSRRMGTVNTRTLYATSCCPGEPGSGSGSGGVACAYGIDEFSGLPKPIEGFVRRNNLPCNCGSPESDGGDGFFYLTWDASLSNLPYFVVWTGIFTCYNPDTDEVCNANMVHVCDFGTRYTQIIYEGDTVTIYPDTVDPFLVKFTVPAMGCSGGCEGGEIIIVIAEPIRTSCCPDIDIGPLLTVTFSDKTGSFTNVGGGFGTRSIPLPIFPGEFTGGDGGWSDLDNEAGDGKVNVNLTCDGESGEWRIDISDTLMGSGTGPVDADLGTGGMWIVKDSYSCDPLELVFTVTARAAFGSPTSTMTVTITE